MASLILCKTINWTAVSAIGQIMCAIATFLAVVVALMPYKRKVKVGLTSVKIDHDNINISFNVVLENCGETTLRIKEWGIKGAGFEVQLGTDQIILDPREVKRIPINQSSFREAIELEKSSMFSVYAIDSGENIFCSKKYMSSDFLGGWDRTDWFK